MVKAFGSPFSAAPGLTHLFPTAEALADADLRSAGLPKTRSQAVQALARAVCEGRIAFDKVADPEAVLAQLSTMPGFSPDAVQYIAMRALREPDAFPNVERDRDLVRTPALGSAAAIEQRSEAWRPWRAYAAAYLSASAPHP